MDGITGEIGQLWEDYANVTERGNATASSCGPIMADGESTHNISACNHTDAASYTSEQFRNESRFWIQRVLVPFVVGVGVLGNVVTIVVLTRRRMRSSTNVYLTALAASDLLYLVFMFTLSLEHYPNIHDPVYYIYWQYRKFGVWLTDATCYTSIWLTVSFTVERYIAVCHPMRGKLLCTESRARKVILLVYAFCFLTTITTPLEWQTANQLDPADNATVVSVTMEPTSLASNDSYRGIFYWFSSVIFVFLPLVLLGIFNSFLIHAVHKSQRQRCQMTQVDQSDSVQTQENKITITLIAVVVLFLFCQIPSAIALICSLFYKYEEGSPEDNVTRGLGNIFNFLVAINAACNFLLYCALSDKYRRTFLLTFLGRWYRTPYQMHSMSCYNTNYTVDGPSSTRQSMRGPSSTMTRKMTHNGTVRQHQNGVQPQPSLQQHVVTPIYTQHNVRVPLLESLKYQFLIHGLPIPHKLDEQNSDIVTKPPLDQDNV